MRRHELFEWDEFKANTNAKKHRVKFEDAAAMLQDPMYRLFHVEEFDAEHSDENEDRYITLGTDPMDRSIVLSVVWTERGDLTRIISARLATRAERQAYETQIQTRRQDRPQDGR